VTVLQRELAAGLTGALSEYLAHGDEAALSRAYDLGREAMADGLGLLDIVRLCLDAARAAERIDDPFAFSRAGEFLLEAIAPFEMSLRGYRDANEQLKSLTARLQERNGDLQRANAAAHAANKDLEAFSYSVSHDLRTPVRHIEGFSQLLLAQCAGLPATALRHVQTIRDSAQRMSQMIEALLNLSRIDRQGLGRRPVDLNALAADVIRELQPDLAGRAIEWHVAPLPQIDCDRDLMRVVFVNLLSNAAKYTRGRQPAIVHVGAERHGRADVIFVKDNGAGFDDRYAEKLFGVFQRLHAQEDFEGTGVGLATVHRIVKKHGGSIWASAAPDKGAAFYFTLSGERVPPPQL
jgi:signal transduction histidine kinase